MYRPEQVDNKREKGNLIQESNFCLNDKMETELNQFLDISDWKKKFGNHIEQRVGLVNFSIIGRNCPQEEREKYYNWDKVNKERIKICKYI